MNQTNNTFVFFQKKKNEYHVNFISTKNKNLITNKLLSFFCLNLKFKLSLFVGLLSCIVLSAQFETNYVPIEISGEIPPKFYHSLKGKTQIDIVLEDEGISRRRRKDFSTKTSFTLREIFLSGSIYYNDPCTPYVRKVTKKIRDGLPGSEKIDVFVSRFVSPNAAIWQDGTLIVNIGLLARLENEAQLAFVIAHEIAHYENKHPFLQYVRKQKPANIQKRALDNLKTSLAYTQQNEIEADAFALELLNKAGYDSRVGARAIELIMSDKTAGGIQQVGALLDISGTDWCGDLEASTYMGQDRHEAHHFARAMLQQRRTKIGTDGASNEGLFLVSEGDFEQISSMAKFELIENYFREADYVSALYRSIMLQKVYPENQYLEGKIVESLFHLYLYKKRGEMRRLLLTNRGNYRTTDLSRLSCFMNKVEEATLQSITTTYLNQQYERYGKEHETIVISTAKYTELVSGRKAAKAHFEYYIKHFPYGKHYLYAKLMVND